MLPEQQLSGAEKAVELTSQLTEMENILHQKCREIPYAGNILEINVWVKISWLEFWPKWEILTDLTM